VVWSFQNFGSDQYVDKRTTVFDLGHRFSKHKKTKFARHSKGTVAPLLPLATPIISRAHYTKGALSDILNIYDFVLIPFERMIATEYTNLWHNRLMFGEKAYRLCCLASWAGETLPRNVYLFKQQFFRTTTRSVPTAASIVTSHSDLLPSSLIACSFSSLSMLHGTSSSSAFFKSSVLEKQ